MDTLVIAIATNDGKTLPESHFGEAVAYYIYRMNGRDYELLKGINNPFGEHEKAHGDAAKAGNIGRLLKPEGVQVLVSRQFGRNIERMRREFLPVIVAEVDLGKVLKRLQENFERLQTEWQKGQERRHLILR